MVCLFVYVLFVCVCLKIVILYNVCIYIYSTEFDSDAVFYSNVIFSAFFHIL